MQALGLFLSFLLVAGLGGVLTAGLVMPGVATANALTDTSVRLFDDLPSELETVPLSEKSTILAADGTVLATFFDQNRIVVSLDEVSQDMQDAVIAIEDHRFYEHGGVDPAGILRAAIRTAQGDTQGASTLTQQYVKNALIQAALEGEDPEAVAQAIREATTASGAEGVQRKLQEAKIAIALEQRLSKDEILERYLNIAQFGLSAYGVEAAAQMYFSVPAAEVNYLQAATIAGITQAPGDWDPLRNPEASETRRNQVLGRMHALGMITTEEYTTGRNTPLEETLNPGESKLGCVAANDVYNAGYFCDFVTKIIRNDEAFGETPGERARLLYRGGLVIRTTLDPALQKAADEEVKRGIPVDDPSGVASAISVIEPGTGRVLAMAQNRIYNSAEDTAEGETSVNYNTDQAYGGSRGFAPGSTFKPFTLLAWLRDGRALNEVIDGRKRERDMRDFSSCEGLASGKWDPGNAEGQGAIMSVADATRNSVNSGYVEMATHLDLCDIMDGAKSLGIHQATGADFEVVPANVLGSDSVAPLTMAAAFAGFASGGTYCEPIAITSVTDSNGNELEVPDANCREVLSPDLANAMNYALSGVWNGTARSVGGLPDRPSAGKTGTTSRNEYTWFVGYTPQISTAVWVGFPDEMRPVQRMTVGGQWVNNMYGSTVAAPTWKRFMTRAHDGLEVRTFSQPPNRYIHGVQVRIPNVVGRSPEDARRTLQGAGFHVRISDSRTYSDSVGSGRVAVMDPGAGTTVTRGTMVTLTLSAGRDPAVVEAERRAREEERRKAEQERRDREERERRERENQENDGGGDE